MLPVQVTIRNVPTSSALEAHIREKAEKLSKLYERICRCRVVVEYTQKHKSQGKLFHVSIDLTVPRKEFVVTRKYGEDVYVVVTQAFDAIERQLEKHLQKLHGHVKSHNGIMHGRVARMHAEDGFGFIDGIDGHEYYFSMTNVAHPVFEKLVVGDTVAYSSEPQSEGRLALHVVKEH